MNNIANLSPFESPKGLRKKILFPNTSRYLAALERQSILRHGVKMKYDVLVCIIIKKISPIKFIDCVGFSVLLMVEIPLAKNWYVKLIFSNCQ